MRTIINGVFFPFLQLSNKSTHEMRTTGKLFYAEMPNNINMPEKQPYLNHTDQNR